MAITLPTATRNTLADAIDTLVGTAGVLVYMDDTTDIASFSLDNPAFGAASTGTITLAAVSATTGITNGTVDKFEVRTSGATVIYSGTITATGGGGDITVDNTNITTGQTVNLTSHTFTIPAS